MLDSIFAILQRDGLERLVSGYQHSAPPADAKVFSSQSTSASRLPAKVDLRRWLTAVEDQQQSNSCTANAVAGAYEYLLKRHHSESAYDISRLFVYYNARRLADPNNISDQGSSIQLAIESLKRDGACAEDTWPFNLQQVNAEPSGDAYEEAGNFLVEEAELVPTNLNLWRHAIASGHPIIFGIKLFQSFDQLRKGVVPDPTGQDAGRDSHGNHAMLCVGFSDPDRVFIVRNSWGTTWGEQGYCYIPYSYMMNEECNLGDSWIVRQVQSPEPDETTWSDDEETILESVEGFLADISDEDYNALTQRMGRYPLEVRLALLFLEVAGADDNISSDEVNLISDQLEPVLSTLGSTISARELINNSKRLMGQANLVEGTVELFADSFSLEVLAGIVNQLLDISDADEEASEEESNLIEQIVGRWQVSLEEDEEPAADEAEEEEEEEEISEWDEEEQEQEEYQDETDDEGEEDGSEADESKEEEEEEEEEVSEGDEGEEEEYEDETDEAGESEEEGYEEEDYEEEEEEV